MQNDKKTAAQVAATPQIRELIEMHGTLFAVALYAAVG
jgi:hypothetical protein